MTDHYELFGVEPDATKDEIKAAYRSEVEGADSSRRAELNRAWNVLSDPMQRQRYDEQRASGGDSDDGDDAADSEEAAVPARRATGARRGPDSKALSADGAATIGSAKNGSGNGGGGGGSDGPDDRPAGRPVPEPTVVLPEGMHLAAKKQRGFSSLFDLSIVIVIVLGCQFIVPGLVSSDYSKYQDVIEEQVDKIDRAQEREDDANDRADDAEAAATRAERSGDAAAETAAREREANAQAAAKAAAADKEAAEQARDDAADKTQGPLLVARGVALVLALLYCVPMSAMTGQTVGKRLRRLWLVRLDGSKVGWGGALVHFIVPLLIGIAIPTFGAIFALGIVFWALRDRNGQGVHDKLAKTLVVDAPPVAE